jgi:hypothetical protein
MSAQQSHRKFAQDTHDIGSGIRREMGTASSWFARR